MDGKCSCLDGCLLKERASWLLEYEHDHHIFVEEQEFNQGQGEGDPAYPDSFRGRLGEVPRVRPQSQGLVCGIRIA